MAAYVDNKELYAEISYCIEQKKLTKKAQDMLILIAERANNKLTYTTQQDKEDCIQFALLDLFKYWDRFKPEKTTNAFSYYTQIAKNGYAKGWNKLHPGKYKGTLSLEGGSNPDSDGIYSI
jgi:DNA-directed RNA polymerase specialized sigma subunit